MLSWFSPIGWSAQLRPFADERWWVLVLSAAASAMFISLAFALAARRDLGSGLVAERLGPAYASVSLGGVFGLAWRTHRGSFLAWTIGLGVTALVLGAAADSVGGQLGGSEAVSDILSTFGGTTLVESYLASSISLLGIGAAAYSISAILRAHAEEEASLAEPVLATGVSRSRWLGSHLLWATAGPASAMLVVGLAAGIPYGLAVGDIGSVLPGVLGGALVQIPAVWVFTATGVLLFGLLPQYAPMVWGVLAACVMLGQVGAVMGLPQIWLDLSPFTHLPHLPGGSLAPTPLLVLMAIAALGCVVGAAGFRRRDLRS
jgi:ABC-2 type transport system permease protein